MKNSRNRSFHQPFKSLKALVKEHELKQPPLPKPASRPQPKLTPEQEDEMFIRAMADVSPLTHNRHRKLHPRPLMILSTLNREEEKTVADLRRLIQTGKGFDIAQTDEYMEARAPGTDPRITRRLHQGRYSIQDHIDLHGMVVEEAETALYQFIKQSIERGRHAVLIVHGRGLRSPGKPVLKGRVYDWLTRGPLKAYVIAIASAKGSDGGAGATYVLLRRRPVAKKHCIR